MGAAGAAGSGSSVIDAAATAATAAGAATGAASGALGAASAAASGMAASYSSGASSSYATSSIPNAALTSDVEKYQRTSAGMSAIEKAIPVPGNWKKATVASIRPKPAMIIAKSRAHGWSDHRPRAASS